MIKKLQIGYWVGQKLDGLEWDNYTVMDYSIELRNNVINKCISLGYKVMLSPCIMTFDNIAYDSLMLWIDTCCFTQR
jgi:hypothetical protein